MPDRRFRVMWCCLALLVGALVAASRPALGATVRSRTDTGVEPAWSGPAEAVAFDRTVEVLADAMHGRSCPPHATDRDPVGHRSPSWHRGTGRRPSRDHGASPLLPVAGGLSAHGQLSRTVATCEFHVTVPLCNPGRSAAPPRAPPALN